MWVVTIDGFKRDEFRHFSDARDYVETLPAREAENARIVLSGHGERRKLSYRLAARTKQRGKYTSM